MTDARITKHVTEVAYDVDDADIRLTQTEVQVLHQPGANVKLTQSSVEVLYTEVSDAELSKVAVEVLMSASGDPVSPGVGFFVIT